MRKKHLAMGGKLFLTAALIATLSPAAAFADVPVASDTKWTVPTKPMTNVVTVGGKDYKVITTQTAANWVTAGPDWLGISNSANLCGDNVNSLSSAISGSGSLMGVWASTANEVPNAYNWDWFYNLYAADQGLAPADLSTEINGTNFDTASGTASGLKYRPEIMWTDALSTTSASSLGTLAKDIREGKYFDGEYIYVYTDGAKKGEKFDGEPVSTTEGEDRNKKTYLWDEAGWDTTKDGYKDHLVVQEAVLTDAAAKYAAPNDSKYNPIEAAIYYDGGQESGTNNAVMNNSAYNNPLLVSNLLYSTAQAVEKVEKETAGYDGMADGTKVTAANATWKTMNALPRTTRYKASTERSMSARDCALAFEQLQKGSVYYVLSQIAAGKTKMKTVAYVNTEPDAGSDMVTIVAMDGVDAFNAGSNAGFAGVAPLCTNALTGGKDYAGTTASGTTTASGATVTYQVPVDYVIQNADVVVMTGIGGTNGYTAYTSETAKQFFTDKCTTDANKKKAQAMEYQCVAPTQANAKNFSVDKSIYGLNVLDFVYPELFPNMELETYWYDNIYHIKSASLKQTMQWTLANTSLPSSADLSKVDSTYKAANTEAKFLEGYNYYVAKKGTDARLKALAAGKGLVTGEPVNFSVLTPSDTYKSWAEAKAAAQVKSQTLKMSAVTKSFAKSQLTSAGKLAKSQTFTVKATGAKTGVTYARSTSNATAKKYITINASTGKITVKKGLPVGSYTVKVTATAKAGTASGAKYAKATKSVNVKVVVGSQTLKLGTTAKSYKASTLKKKAQTLNIKATTTSGKITSASVSKAVNAKGKAVPGFKAAKVSNSKIKLTVPKALAKGTYTVTVSVKAPKVAKKYAALTLTKTIKVTVK